MLCLSQWSIWSVLLFGAAVLLGLWKITGDRQCWLWLTLSVFFLGGYCCCGWTQRQRAEELSLCEEYPADPDETSAAETAVKAQGRVVKISEKERRKEFLLEDITLTAERSDGQIKIQKLLVYLPISFQAVEGDRILVSGVLRTFDHAVNPGQFDYSDYQASLGVNLFLEADSGIILVRGERTVDGWLGNLKRYGVNVFMQVGGDSGGTMAALVLGDKTYLPEERYELYLTSGIGHILTLSGLHLSLFGVGLYGILRKKLTLPAWPAAVLMTGGILAYLKLIGTGISAYRAAVALVISLLGGCLGKTYDSLSAAALGMILILAEYPLQITRPSFWLSFGAVFAMGGVLPELNRWLRPRKKISKALLAPLAIQLAMMPVIAVNQYTLQTYSVLLNMLVVPMMGMILGVSIAVLVTGAVWPGIALRLAVPVNLVFKAIDKICGLSLTLPGSVLSTGCPSVARLAVYGIVAGGFILYIHWRNRVEWEAMETREYVEAEFGFLRKPRRISKENEDGKFHGRSWGRWLTLAVVSLVLAAVLILKIPGRQLSVTFLDVAQGDCIFLETPGGTAIMVDCGSSSERSLSEYRVLPFLSWAGVTHLDYLVLTHLDEDHINGVESMIESGISVGTVLIPSETTEKGKVEDMRLFLEENDIKMVNISAEDQIICGEVEIMCVSPVKNAVLDSENEASAVLLVTYKDFSCLLTGDTEGRGEKQAQNYLSEYLEKTQTEESGITLLKVAHHGSRYSTSEEFLDLAKPTAAVISCGEGNSYGHPHEELLDRLEEVSCRIYCTSDCGAVMVKTDGVRWSIKGFLEQ